MSLNITCPHINGTCVTTETSSVGLAVGLTLFFLLLLGVAAGLVAYFQRRRLGAMWQPGRAESKENVSQTPGDGSPRYTGMVRARQSIQQAPIYENFKGQPRDSTAIDMGSSPEENLYLQCDGQDEAIYSNDPACSLSILPDTQEEDVYVVPDAF